MTYFSTYSPRQRRIIALAFVSGGFVVAANVSVRVKQAQKEQRALCDAVASESSKDTGGLKKQKVAVNRVFWLRLQTVLGICVPSPFSLEAVYVLVQSGLLISRTLLSDQIAALEGTAGQAVTAQDWPAFQRMLVDTALTCVPAAIVNSGLKFMQTYISLAFRKRITEHLHQRYLSNRTYYVASTLGGMSNADQRITEDVEKFAFNISELFSYTFKPVLDIVLFSRSLAKTVGYKGQLTLYLYFLLCAGVLRRLSPPLALMTTQEAALSGNFRNAHQRLVATAEEVAFNDPPGGDTERMILNDHLYRVLKHARLSAFQRFWQQVADGYLVKYAASIIGLCVYAAPLYFRPRTLSPDKLTGDYIRSMRLMMHTSGAIGQLVLVYKRLTTLAGNTSRVAELLESVNQLGTAKGRAGLMQSLDLTDRASEAVGTSEAERPSISAPDRGPAPPPRLLFGDYIKFERVTLHSPDGTLLVRELSLEVRQGESLILMGPNGSGKSSLFRVLAELWPLACGTVVRPPRGDIFYLSQRPYLVRGTLRDQILYPFPPRKVAHEAAVRNGTRALIPGEHERREEDRKILEVFGKVELGGLVQRGEGLDQMQNWDDTLSGGEKQRVAMARLLFHNPKFAVLDECTSAVSADGEETLYRRLKEAGITMLSIAHRPTVRKFHSVALTFDGSQSGFGWKYERLSSISI
ncbi:ABC Acyl Transporter [Klebsormidium nitens]|uniref:ABC Acyl Transporter n=1 Tax=Klebsormidium nitens TaxID=105231 RepID=A0A1Y1HZK7_KLENI|nr:ABC Acyl Transporter [Klebsormidium nitens]|eukprot:GAQ84085.1 ABC Acyl Transporter [Klebsormidium nitens]